MMVAKEVLQIRLSHPTLPQGVNVYLLTSKDELGLIDAGYGDEQSIKTIVETIRNSGLDIKKLSLIVNTHGHPDHAGGDARLKQLSGARIAIHRLEAHRIQPLKADILLEDGDTAPTSAAKLRVAHTPGHSPGEICLYDEDRKLLFSGDHIVEGTLTGTVYIGPPDGSVAQYLQSIKKVSTLDMGIILPGHGPPIKDPQKKISDILQHHRERELQIVEILRGSEKTADEIAKAIYGNLVVGNMAKGAVIGRVQKMIGDGLIEVVKRDGVDYYRLTGSPPQMS